MQCEPLKMNGREKGSVMLPPLVKALHSEQELAAKNTYQIRSKHFCSSTNLSLDSASLPLSISANHDDRFSSGFKLLMLTSYLMMALL